MPSHFPKNLLHPLCLFGAVFVAVGFGASVLGLVIDIDGGASTAYQGLLTFVLYPTVMFFGLFLVAWGLILERRRAKKLECACEEWKPRLDPAVARHRRILFGLGAVAATIVASSIVGAYHAYEFTESTEFCGALCHTPMEPQHTAHQFSPHANVGCTTCHVGPGITGYVDAKVSGMRQLYQMLASSYPRPIKAGHDKVLVAGQSCEHCHRPDKFWGAQLDSRTRFGYDFRNSTRSFNLLMKPSGLTHLPLAGHGIHWHMKVDGKIWFRSTDERRQEIPWVRVERPDGKVVVYKDSAWSESRELLPEHHMGCIDCHSRPAHQFQTPEDAVNRALASALIDQSLPFIKKVGVSTLARDYASADDAHSGIREHVEGFYREQFQGKVLERKESLEQAITELQTIFSRNSFPGMNVDWSTYPNNAGHRKFPGCFRCHSGRHVSADGEVLTHACDACHVFLEKARDSENLTEIAADDAMFHPFQHEAHDKIQCWNCHAGMSSPYDECVKCHEQAQNSHAMSFECSICHAPGASRTTGDSCAPCHPSGESALHAHKDHRDCLACHSPHKWEVALERCGTCHPDQNRETWEKQLPGFGGVLSTMGGLPVGKK